MTAFYTMHSRAGARVRRLRAWPFPGAALAAVLALVATSLSWSASQIDRGLGGHLGLALTLFATPDFAGAPRLTQRAGEVSLAFLDADPDLPRRSFSVRWEGYWDRPDGPIDLYAGGDDEVYVFLDGELVMERNPARGMTTVAERLAPSGGLQQLRVDFVQHGGAALVNVLWAPAGEPARAFGQRTLFPAEPDRETLFMARLAATRERVARLMWLASLVSFAALVVAPLGVRIWRGSGGGTGIGRGAAGAAAGAAAWCAANAWVLHLLMLALAAAVTVRTLAAWWGGLDPVTLWADDLVWAALVKAPDVGMMLGVPAHAPPGFFLALRGLRGVFPDPEWSLQILPFASGIAAGPVLALAAWRLTASGGLALLTASLVALNPLLAHYSVFVKQYSFDFLATSAVLCAGAGLLAGPTPDSRRLVRVAVLSGVTLFFSTMAALTSVPLVALAGWRLWHDRPDDRRRVLVAAGSYGLLFSGAYLAMRSRTNPLVRQGFAEGFMPLYSVAAAWEFIIESGRRMLETSLPSWTATELTNPETVSWPLPLLVVGLAWWLVRPETRLLGVLAITFYGGFLVASAARIYPLGTGRPDIFAFPVAILLAVAGVQGLTSRFRRREVVRGAVGVAVAALAIVSPIRPQYFGVDDVRLIERVVAEAREDDALILSPTGTYLAAYYGPWPMRVAATAERTNATDARIVRGSTLHQLPERDPTDAVAAFLRDEGEQTVWFVAFRTETDERLQTLAALEAERYVPELVEQTVRGRLYRATLSGAAVPTGTYVDTPTRTPPR